MVRSLILLFTFSVGYLLPVTSFLPFTTGCCFQGTMTTFQSASFSWKWHFPKHLPSHEFSQPICFDSCCQCWSARFQTSSQLFQLMAGWFPSGSKCLLLPGSTNIKTANPPHFQADSVPLHICGSSEWYVLYLSQLAFKLEIVGFFACILVSIVAFWFAFLFAVCSF